MLKPEIVLQVDKARSGRARRGRIHRMYYTLTNHSNKPVQLYLPPCASHYDDIDVPFQVRETPITRLSEPVRKVLYKRPPVDLRKVYKVILLPDFAISGYLTLVGKGGTYALLPVGRYRIRVWYDSRPLAQKRHHEGLWLGITNAVEFELHVMP